MTSVIALCHPTCQQQRKTISTYCISPEPALIKFKIEELRVWQKSAYQKVPAIKKPPLARYPAPVNTVKNTEDFLV